MVLIGFFAFSSMMLGSLFRKYVLIFFHQSIYYCQQVIDGLPIRLPNNLGEASLMVFLVMLMYITIKLVATMVKTSKIGRDLSASTVRSPVIKRMAKKLGLQNKLSVYLSDHPSAFCFGFINTKIYVSTGLVNILSEIELEAVMRHERYHLENKDAFTCLFASVVQTMFPFFPVISDVSKRYRILNEVEADRAAIRGMKNSKSLISVLKKLLSHDHKNTFNFAPSLGEWDTLEYRVKKLVNQKVERRRSPVTNIVVSLVSLVVLVGLSLSQVTAFEYHNGGGDAILLCSKDKNCTNICESKVVEALFSHI